MKYYHGSQDANIQELTTVHSKDGLVYVTSSRLVALTYAVRGYPNLFTTSNGKEVFLELVPGIFEKMTKGKSAYIYTLENKKYSKINQNKLCGHTCCYSYNKNVKVIDKEYIDDAYQEFKKYIDKGLFTIIKCEDIPNKEKKIKDILNQKKIINLNNKVDYTSLLK